MPAGVPAQEAPLLGHLPRGHLRLGGGGDPAQQVPGALPAGPRLARPARQPAGGREVCGIQVGLCDLPGAEGRGQSSGQCAELWLEGCQEGEGADL